MSIYSRLDPQAKDMIKAAGISIAEYVRHVGHWPAGEWHGDVCGCPDDRCIGYHHGNRDDCLCLLHHIDELRTEPSYGVSPIWPQR